MLKILIQSIPFLGIGFLLGIRHAFEADHVATISNLTLKTKNRFQSLLLGAWWGLGHTATLLIVGSLILIFKVNIPEFIANIFETAVAIALGFLGLELIYKTFSEKWHSHHHSHGEEEHLHFHTHESEHIHAHRHKSFALGMLHGLAGSAALMLIIIGSATSITQGITFIILFGLGSILGMSLISFTISIPFSIAYQAPRLEYYLKFLTGGLSILIAGSLLSAIW